MAVCKFCKEIIRELKQVRTGVETGRFFIDKNGYANYNLETFDGDGDFQEWKCYECGETLFEDWGEAEEFLKTKDELQELVAKKINKKEEI